LRFEAGFGGAIIHDASLVGFVIGWFVWRKLIRCHSDQVVSTPFVPAAGRVTEIMLSFNGRPSSDKATSTSLRSYDKYREQRYVVVDAVDNVRAMVDWG